MNTIIIYSSKYGCAKDCADYLKSSLSDNVTLFDINNTDSSIIDLETYDTIILGSSIYIGAISKKMQTFCMKHVDVLSNKTMGIFLCCGFPAEIDSYFTKNFPSLLLEKAAITACFGGDARPQNMKFIDKVVLKVATKGNYEHLKISYENMDSFIRTLESKKHS